MRYKLNYLWRLFITALCFTGFGVGGLILSFCTFPLIVLFSKDPELAKLRFRKTIQLSFKLFFWVIHTAKLIEFKIEGLEDAKKDTSCILVANHPSLIDVVALISVLPNITCIVKQSLYQNPFMKHVIKGAGYIPNIESEQIISLCKSALDRGENLIIFPEGTRSVPGKKMELKRGASQLAIKLNAPIRIAKITVSPSTLTKAESWYDIPPRRSLFHIEFKHKIFASELLQQGVRTSIAARRITSEIKANIDSPMESC